MQWSFVKSEGTNMEYFDYGHFQKHLQKKFQIGGGYYYWNGLRYFLYEYEMEKVRKRGSQKIDWNLFVKKATKIKFRLSIFIHRLMIKNAGKRLSKDLVNLN